MKKSAEKLKFFSIEQARLFYKYRRMGYGYLVSYMMATGNSPGGTK